MKKHVQMRISGKVQGVWYRASTQRKAIALGLCGKVRNEADGSVYAEAEGTPEQVDKLIEWCKSGPPHARVDEVKCTEGTLKDYTDFSIER